MNRHKKTGWSGMFTVVLVLALLMGSFLTGCGRSPNADQNLETEQITLYFGDQEAMYLVPETRNIDQGDGILEAAIVNELVKGPQKEGSVPTIPEGTKVLSVTVSNGVAYVNFSNEFKTAHWGGSAGERMTIYSVVNTLTELPEVEKVQFLLEGDKQESILGHMDTTVPIDPDPSLLPE